MNASHGEGANACLPELRQAASDKAAVSLTRIGGVKKITRLHKKVNPLSYGVDGLRYSLGIGGWVLGAGDW